MSLTYLLVDDHPIVRSGLRALLDGLFECACVGEAGTAAEGLERARATTPDLVLLDLDLPDRPGLELCRAIRAELPATRILILTMADDEGLLREAIRLGAAGYLVKRATGAELSAAIAAVMRGDLYVHPSLTRSLLADRPREPAGAAGLTGREREVLRLIAAGHTNAEAAGMLGISIRTVESHRANVVRKLGAPRRAELVRLAREWGIMVDPSSSG